MADLDNGKEALRTIIDEIRVRYDTDGWGSDRWQDAIEDSFSVMNDDIDGTVELCDIMAHVIDKCEGDTEALANIACYGLAHDIAEDVSAAYDMGEEPYLLS